jgi:tight adherence protein C
MTLAMPSWIAVDPQPIHIAAMISLVVLLVMLLAGRVVSAREVVWRRATTQRGLIAGTSGGLRSRESEITDRFIGHLERLLAPKQRPALSEIRRQLTQAGFFSPVAVPLFYGLRILLAVALPLVFPIVLTISSLSMSRGLLLAVIICLAGIGYILPPVLLDFRVKAMRETYRRTFPDVLDLMVICLESGQSLASALERIGREMANAAPAMAANLHLLNLELRAGSSVTMALDNLQTRLGVDEVKSLAVLLKQSEELGASVAETLRVFSDEMRDKRLIRAETKANVLPVKMTIPLGLFIFPVILLVILVPVVIRIMRAFV